jgi:pyridoxamine 5'-phosphate oxidase
MKKVLSLCALLIVTGGVLFAVSYDPSNIKHPQPLNIQQMKGDPMAQFQDWLGEAKQSMGELDASAFVLGTVNEACEPSTRGMMAKSINGTGFTFYGDLNSEKFQDLSQNPAASATFMWLDEQRQVSFKGKAVPVSKREMQDTFEKRSKGAKITSHISDQGEELESHAQMKQQHQSMSKQYENKKVPMPDNWMGYRFEPEVVIFWQAGEHNMHSRVLYTKGQNGKWKKTLLHP